jgi:hypothetical protein
VIDIEESVESVNSADSFTESRVRSIIRAMRDVMSLHRIPMVPRYRVAPGLWCGAPCPPPDMRLVPYKVPAQTVWLYIMSGLLLASTKVKDERLREMAEMLRGFHIDLFKYNGCFHVDEETTLSKLRQSLERDIHMRGRVDPNAVKVNVITPLIELLQK